MLFAEGSCGPLTGASVPAQASPTTNPSGKQISDLVSPDTHVDEYGNVIGTLHKVADWKEFSSTAKYKNGHFFPLKLDEQYSGQEIEVDGPETKGKKASDLNWYLFVKDNQSEFTFKCNGKTLFTINFRNTILE